MGQKYDWIPSKDYGVEFFTTSILAGATETLTYILATPERFGTSMNVGMPDDVPSSITIERVVGQVLIQAIDSGAWGNGNNVACCVRFRKGMIDDSGNIFTWTDDLEDANEGGNEPFMSERWVHFNAAYDAIGEPFTDPSWCMWDIRSKRRLEIGEAVFVTLFFRNNTAAAHQFRITNYLRSYAKIN